MDSLTQVVYREIHSTHRPQACIDVVIVPTLYNPLTYVEWKSDQ